MFSLRIERIASKVPVNSNLADVGCDHGYLIIEAYLNNKVNKAIAIDNTIENFLKRIPYSSIATPSSSLNNWFNIHSASYSLMSSYPWPTPKNMIGFLIT